MVFQVRQKDGKSFVSGNWLSENGLKKDFSPKMVKIKVKKTRKFKDYLIPTSWEVIIPKKNVKLLITPINPEAFMETLVPYWEGPIKISGTHSGVGYLEMTGYGEHVD
jgi:predicted secreted hydrolase